MMRPVEELKKKLAERRRKKPSDAKRKKKHVEKRSKKPPDAKRKKKHAEKRSKMRQDAKRKKKHAEKRSKMRQDAKRKKNLLKKNRFKKTVGTDRLNSNHNPCPSILKINDTLTKVQRSATRATNPSNALHVLLSGIQPV